MAVSSTELSDADFFIQLGMLIIQGRKWDSFRRCRSRNLHCPTVRNSTPLHHQCSAANAECQNALSYQQVIHSIWQRNAVVAVDVILLPECTHQEPSVLLEKWLLQPTDEFSSMPKLSLMQAIDSTIHFSQLSSWWASTNGCQPRNIQYRVYEDVSASPRQFIEPAIDHQFPVCHGVKVKLQYLPRQKKIPELFCFRCSNAVGSQHVEVVQAGSPGRGRGLSHRGHRRLSRHSSASSDSLSPSVTRLDASPFGSPLLSTRFHRGISSSSSSRGSSRTASPCVSRSPSEHNLVCGFEASRRMGEPSDDIVKAMQGQSPNRNDSGFAGDSMVIDQDEELANQLDSLSDSDLSDDYVIDGPVGSPGLVGSCVASPDDARVQMLQNTFAGWHCRRPTFDRLMGDAAAGPNRTRHSSLDSAVSNMERLDLRARRRLSRTSSDGQDFSNCAQLDRGPEDSEKGFFIRDIKKRHKMQGMDMSDVIDTPNTMSNNTFFASFCTDSETLWKTSDDAEKTPIFNPFNSSNKSPSHAPVNEIPKYDFTNVTGLSKTPRPLTLSMPCLASGTFDYSPGKKADAPHCDSELQGKVAVESRRVVVSGGANGRWPCPSSVASNTDNGNLNFGIKANSHCNASGINSMSPPPQRSTSKITPCQVSNIDLSLEEKSIPVVTDRQDKCDSRAEARIKDKKLETEIPESSSALLRSPPSKLRILLNHCVDKNFLHNPPRQPLHKAANNVQCGPARRLQFFRNTEKPVCTSPAPIRRNNSIRFEFDEDMPNVNQRSSRSTCRGKCMKKDGMVSHNHARVTPNRRLLGSFEESIIHNRLEVLGTVEGFNAQLGASGSFCPAKVKLPVPVQFFHISEDNAPSPYLGTMSLKGRECGKRGYHIPRKGTIQLTLFNPNKSVVKMFVILYDVTDMPPGHRTFLRHRIYCKPTSSPSVDCNGTVSAESQQAKLQGNMLGGTCLRYFVNLWLESSKTNKVYIHGEIKMLFSLASNEWDSGNTFELQSETEFPKNPKYSSKR